MSASTHPVRLATLVEFLGASCEVRTLLPDRLDAPITGLRPTAAAGEGDVTFVKTPRHLGAVSETCATLLILPAGSEIDEPALAARGVAAIAYSANPRLDFSLVGGIVAPRPAATGVSPAAHVDESCELGADVSIAPGCVIGAARIGAGTVVGPGCIVGDGCVIGSGCLLEANVVVGAEGFGYERDERGYPIKFPHVGVVRIGDRVDVGAGTVIARGALGDTVISDGVKIDNLCHIAHNVRIGQDTMVVAHAMIGGSSVIGERAWIGPGALVSNGLTIGDDAFVTLGAVVTRDVAASERVTGNFAVEHRKFLAHLREMR